MAPFRAVSQMENSKLENSNVNAHIYKLHESSYVLFEFVGFLTRLTSIPRIDTYLEDGNEWGGSDQVWKCTEAKNQPSKLAHDDMPPLDQEVQLGYPVHIIDRIIQISYLSTSEPLPYCPSVQTPETGEVRGRALPALLERLRLSGEQNSTQKMRYVQTKWYEMKTIITTKIEERQLPSQLHANVMLRIYEYARLNSKILWIQNTIWIQNSCRRNPEGTSSFVRLSQVIRFVIKVAHHRRLNSTSGRYTNSFLEIGAEFSGTQIILKSLLED